MKKADVNGSREIVAATTNQGKVREIRKALEGLGLEIRALTDFGPVPKVEEDGKTFSENALIKARFYAEYLGKTVVSDDSGLEVDALDGMPGVWSARYAGEGATGRGEQQQAPCRSGEGAVFRGGGPGSVVPSPWSRPTAGSR